MKFNQIEPEDKTKDYNLELWESENNIWQVRLDKVAFGCRVHVTQRGLLFFQTEYCAGADPLWQQALMTAIIQIVSKYPENISFEELEKIWPRWQIRPMFNDLKCWHQLCEMAELPLEFELAMLKYRYGQPLEEAIKFLD